MARFRYFHSHFSPTLIHILRSIDAAWYLALLGRPEGIFPLRMSLVEAAEYEYTVMRTISASALLGAGVLVNTLAELSDLPSSIYLSGMPVPLADEALRALAEIVPQPIPENEMEYVADTDYDVEFTQESRHKTLAYYKEKFKQIEPQKRYYKGELLTPTHLVNNLTNPYGYRDIWANSNLVAITGEDFGFDPDLDLVANITALEKWREYIKKHPNILESGGWAFGGEKLPYPNIST